LCDQVARAHAALNDRKKPSSDDLRLGIKLAMYVAIIQFNGPIHVSCVTYVM
jgi:hypothetical protein